MATTSSASTGTTGPTTDSTPARPKINLRNPTPLSATQEAQVRDLYHKRVRGYCAAEIKEFAACAINRTITATWVCRQQRLAMNSCMVKHAVPEEEDRAREEWFATRDERRKAKEKEEQRTAARRDEIFKMMREEDENKAKEKGKGWFS